MKKKLTRYEGLHCANCGAALHGEFCHECGQSIHSVIKPMHGMLEDTMDIVFHIDGRVVHTVPPLLLKPGFLTLEYFSGRRVRYVAPFRLMFVLSLLAFFVIHLQLDSLSRAVIMHDRTVSTSDTFQDTDNPAEVRQELTEQLGDLERARATLPHVAQPDLDVAERALRAAADRRLRALAGTPMSTASQQPPASASSIVTDKRTAVEKPAAENDATLPPLHISWLPDAANARLRLIGQRLQANWHALKDGDAAARQDSVERMTAGFFGVLPPILFVLMPVFALLLKLVYVFKHRLYIEHLIVALHSHAFLFLSLLLGTLLAMLATWVRPHAGWLASGLGWVENLLWLWTPLYLLIMQKRVYRQAWPMTLVKYLFVGCCYGWMLVTALIIAFMLGLAH